MAVPKHERRRRVAGAAASSALLAVVLAACAGGARPKFGSTETTITVPTTTPPTAPAAGTPLANACAARTQQIGLGRVDLSMSKAALGLFVEQTQTALQNEAAGVTSPLKEDLLTEKAARAQLGLALVAKWGDNDGSALETESRAAGSRSPDLFVIGDGLAIDGAKVSAAQLQALTARNRLRLAVACGALPALPTAPVTDENAVPATLLATKQGSGTVVRVGINGEGDVLGGPAGVRLIQALPSPDGTQLGLIGADASGRLDLYLAPANLPGNAVKFPDAPPPVRCGDWDQDSSRMVVLADDASDRAHLSFATINSSFIPLAVDGVPARALGCPAFDFNGHVAFPVGEPLRGYTVIGRVDVDGGTVTTVLKKDHCDLLQPRVTPGIDRISVIASCDDVAQSGLYVAPVEGGELTKVLGGIVTSFAWSPDGDTIGAAVVEPDGDGQNPSIYLVGTQTRDVKRLAGPGLDEPAWFSDAAVGGPPEPLPGQDG